MDFSVAASGSANALLDLLKIAHSAHNKDKNSVCRTIDLSEKTIVDWYNEINLAYAPFRANYILGKKISDEKIISDFLIFAQSRTNSHAIECAIQSLEKTKKKIADGDMRRIVGDVDIKLISTFLEDLKEFHKIVFDTKIIMLENGIPKLEGNSEDAKNISIWIKRLDKSRSEIRTCSMEILQQLECNEEMFKKISNQDSF